MSSLPSQQPPAGLIDTPLKKENYIHPERKKIIYTLKERKLYTPLKKENYIHP